MAQEFYITGEEHGVPLYIAFEERPSGGRNYALGYHYTEEEKDALKFDHASAKKTMEFFDRHGLFLTSYFNRKIEEVK